LSSRGHGSDETIAISVLLRIGSQLISASADLFADGRAYAAAALTRQLVEIEYLAWAFEVRDRDGERWLRSTRQDRESFFRPSKIRAAAGGHFRGQDYWRHCELGGHPVPSGTALLHDQEPELGQLMLADMLVRAALDWEAADRLVKAASTLAEHLRRRRPAALSADAYGPKAAGPFAQFCHEMHKPMTPPHEIARTIEAWRRVGIEVSPEGLSAPTLDLEVIARVTGDLLDRSAYDTEERWSDARDQAIDRVRQRIRRFDRKVKGATQV
jgi:hypothetical protein